MIVTVSGFSADNGWEHSGWGALEGAGDNTYTHGGLGGAGRGDVAVQWLGIKRY